MKTLLVGIVLVAVGMKIVMWAVKRSIDINDERNPDKPKEDHPATKLAADAGDGSWPLWKTGGHTN